MALKNGKNTIYKLMLFQLKENNECLFSRVWTMMYANSMIDENEKEDLEFEQKYFLPFAMAYDKALKRLCEEYDISFKAAFGLSFISNQPLLTKDDGVFETI